MPRNEPPSGLGHQPRAERGFTLIELLIGLLVVSILLAATAPSLGQLRAASTVRTEADQLRETLQRARMLAVLQARQVVVCPSASGQACAETADWSSGWLTFVDSDGNGERESGERVEAVYLVSEPRPRITAPGTRQRLRFSPDGSAFGSNATLSICSTDKRVGGKRVVLSPTGRARIARAPSATCDRD